MLQINDRENNAGNLSLGTQNFVTVPEGTVKYLSESQFYRQGEWAISALNGFCVASTEEELVSLLDGGELVYPIVVFCSCQNFDHQSVVALARRSYIKRFCDRYDYRVEQLDLPPVFLEFFKDDYFEEREQRRKKMLDQIQVDYLRRLNYGW